MTLCDSPDDNKKCDLPGSSKESMEEYEKRVAEETDQIINQEISTQRINGRRIRGNFSSHVEREDDGQTTTNVVMRGHANWDYCIIAWMQIYMQIFYSVFAQVRIKFVPIISTNKTWLNVCVHFQCPPLLLTVIAWLN